MNRKLLNKFSGAVKAAIAAQSEQPNRELTTILLLTPGELPGAGWAVDVQLDMLTHAMRKKGKYPEIERAKEINSTFSRRTFKGDSSSGKILIEVAPLANATDAASWVMWTSDRVKRTASKMTDLEDYRDLGEVNVPGVEHSRALQYSLVRKHRVRATFGVATSVDDVYVFVRCWSMDNVWSMDDVIEIVRLQIEKIKAIRGSKIT